MSYRDVDKIDNRNLSKQEHTAINDLIKNKDLVMQKLIKVIRLSFFTKRIIFPK